MFKYNFRNFQTLPYFKYKLKLSSYLLIVYLSFNIISDNKNKKKEYIF